MRKTRLVGVGIVGAVVVGGAWLVNIRARMSRPRILRREAASGAMTTAIPPSSYSPVVDQETFAQTWSA